MDSCEPPCKGNLGPLQEQPGHLTAEPSLQPSRKLIQCELNVSLSLEQSFYSQNRHYSEKLEKAGLLRRL